MLSILLAILCLLMVAVDIFGFSWIFYHLIKRMGRGDND